MKEVMMERVLSIDVMNKLSHLIESFLQFSSKIKMWMAANNKWIIRYMIKNACSEHHRGKDYLGDLDMVGRIILK